MGPVHVLVHPVGFEPTHLAALEPESSVYANFTTGANGCIRYQIPENKASPFFQIFAERGYAMLMRSRNEA